MTRDLELERLTALVEEFAAFRDRTAEFLEGFEAELHVQLDAHEEGMSVEEYLCRENGGPCKKGRAHKCHWKAPGALKAKGA